MYYPPNFQCGCCCHFMLLNFCPVFYESIPVSRMAWNMASPEPCQLVCAALDIESILQSASLTNTTPMLLSTSLPSPHRTRGWSVQSIYDQEGRTRGRSNDEVSRWNSNKLGTLQSVLKRLQSDLNNIESKYKVASIPSSVTIWYLLGANTEGCCWSLIIKK